MQIDWKKYVRLSRNKDLSSSQLAQIIRKETHQPVRISGVSRQVFTRRFEKTVSGTNSSSEVSIINLSEASDICQRTLISGTPTIVKQFRSSSSSVLRSKTLFHSFLIVQISCSRLNASVAAYRRGQSTNLSRLFQEFHLILFAYHELQSVRLCPIKISSCNANKSSWAVERAFRLSHAQLQTIVLGL